MKKSGISLPGAKETAYRSVYFEPTPLSLYDNNEIPNEKELEEKAQQIRNNKMLAEEYDRKKNNQDLPLLLPRGYHPNQHQITGVHLHRDRDDFPIPYISIYGITLITALRLGIIETQIEKLYSKFLQLPLYEDMAPWNIVLMGNTVDYIDYDTKDMFYDLDIPKAYQVMTVLMNYKRTVEDFHKCGSKGKTVYGLPYVSDCVGSSSESSNSV